MVCCVRGEGWAWYFIYVVCCVRGEGWASYFIYVERVERGLLCTWRGLSVVCYCTWMRVGRGFLFMWIWLSVVCCVRGEGWAWYFIYVEMAERGLLCTW